MSPIPPPPLIPQSTEVQSAANTVHVFPVNHPDQSGQEKMPTDGAVASNITPTQAFPISESQSNLTFIQDLRDNDYTPFQTRVFTIFTPNWGPDDAWDVLAAATVSLARIANVISDPQGSWPLRRQHQPNHRNVEEGFLSAVALLNERCASFTDNFSFLPATLREGPVRLRLAEQQIAALKGENETLRNLLEGRVAQKADIDATRKAIQAQVSEVGNRVDHFGTLVVTKLNTKANATKDSTSTHAPRAQEVSRHNRHQAAAASPLRAPRSPSPAEPIMIPSQSSRHATPVPDTPRGKRSYAQAVSQPPSRPSTPTAGTPVRKKGRIAPDTPTPGGSTPTNPSTGKHVLQNAMLLADRLPGTDVSTLLTISQALPPLMGATPGSQETPVDPSAKAKAEHKAGIHKYRPAPPPEPAKWVTVMIGAKIQREVAPSVEAIATHFPQAFARAGCQSTNTITDGRWREDGALVLKLASPPTPEECTVVEGVIRSLVAPHAPAGSTVAVYPHRIVTHIAISGVNCVTSNGETRSFDNVFARLREENPWLQEYPDVGPVLPDPHGLAKPMWAFRRPYASTATLVLSIHDTANGSVSYKAIKGLRCDGQNHRCSLFEKKKPVPQCFRCQRWGHNQARCLSNPRCVQCGEPHSFEHHVKLASCGLADPAGHADGQCRHPPICANCRDIPDCHHRADDHSCRCFVHRNNEEWHRNFKPPADPAPVRDKGKGKAMPNLASQIAESSTGSCSTENRFEVLAEDDNMDDDAVA
ncbi:hypothetical protein BXZ70DRAFT_960780 [Cristinia sonorae]|uniref:Uncharacterized protein n=1 Tax=Cristinia sonorae TaxID=1940300 RepID=A0A8K0XK64_9AGAR|nr:hypothetical protein BXZ70DRAFT_960780 [Cristinia sonorae]